MKLGQMQKSIIEENYKKIEESYEMATGENEFVIDQLNNDYQYNELEEQNDEEQ